ncbi:FxSxx-COOH cyclophane-containing RiPP peptide [Streptomyces buecherae]|uniref:FxSxx-COOH cyclophane-containing RiPP peptide n=1 Tax=Streptomyces buecherae TaxID=2763006 RepID=UPI00164D1DB0|nr:FxSxx-COOH cyclophane-containing RiPP peptide [Streptomyces buecherae]MBC3981680.1 FXSXX-COOH protein [Streptomyces buecherae]MBC3993350.1 FXSXX-COOH protein [Streptomyces buecherae]QNJ40152.1 FXSXX-COOH protein [Streptomyces buecherae]
MSRDSAAHEGTAQHTDQAGRAGAEGSAGPLPDVLGLDLATLRTLEHPVLDEVLGDLRDRVAQPREMLWAFNSAC